MSKPRRLAVVAALGAAQTLAWASSYYLPAILAAPMAATMGVSPAWVFGAFSGALLLSAALGPWAGAVIDRRGGRPVLAASNLVFAAGLAVLAAIAKGTLPLALFGPAGYGLRSGLLSAPARVAQAAAPLGFALAIEASGAGALWLTAGLSLASGAALLALTGQRRPRSG